MITREQRKEMYMKRTKEDIIEELFRTEEYRTANIEDYIKLQRTVTELAHKLIAACKES